jgi:aspartyl aminopeptidase
MKSNTERAILARVNRKLVKQGGRLLVCPENSRWFNNLGRYYCVNNNNIITAQFVDLDDWAKELAVI